MKKLTMIALSLFALAAVGCSNTGSNNANPYGTSYGTLNQLGQCISPTTGQQLPYTSCSATGATQPCYGNYFYFNGSTWMQGVCNGSNCSGYSLYNQAGQQVRCM